MKLSLIGFIAVQIARVLPYICALKFFSIEQAGQISILYLYLNYVRLSQLGVVNEMNRSVPVTLGAKKFSAANSMKMYSLIWCIFTALSVAIAMFLYAVFWVQEKDADIYKWISYATLPVALSQYYEMSNKSSQGFERLAYSQIVFFMISIFGCFYSVKLQNFDILFAAYIFSYILQISIMYKRQSYKINWRKGVKTIRIMFKRGMPIATLTILSAILLSLDRLVVSLYFTEYEIGIYSVSVLVTGSFLLIPHGITQRWYSEVGVMYGKTKNKELIIQEALNMSLKIFITMILCGVIFYLIFSYVATHYVHKIIESLSILPFFILTSIFYSYTICIGLVCMILSEFRQIISNMIIALILLTLLLSISIMVFKSLFFTAMASTVAMMVYALIVKKKIIKI